MYDTTYWLAVVTAASPQTETLMQSVGMLAVALVGTLMLAGLLRRLLFTSISEGGAGLDRRFLTSPRPANALECARTAKVLWISRR